MPNDYGKGALVLLKIICDWNNCRFNSNKDPDSKEVGECQFDGIVELIDPNGIDGDNKLECRQFEWEAK